MVVHRRGKKGYKSTCRKRTRGVCAEAGGETNLVVIVFLLICGYVPPSCLTPKLGRSLLRNDFLEDDPPIEGATSWNRIDRGADN